MSLRRREFLCLSAQALIATLPRLTNALPLSRPHQGEKSWSELGHYDALGLAQLLREKKVSVVELVEDTIRRIEAVNPRLNAVLTRIFDLSLARARAKNSPAEGVFAGVPILLKDIVEYKDADIDQGSRLLASFVAKNGRLNKQNSPFVDAIEKSGFIVTGVTNAPECGLIDTTESVLYGPARNPWNSNFTTGGSSGGSAAAVASGIVPLAHANDGGGSIRIPASHCGVFGLKPSRGRELVADSRSASGDPAINIISDLCVSRSVRDTAAFLNAVERKSNPVLPPVGYVSSPLRKRMTIRLALIGLNGKKPDPEVETAIRSTAKLCESLGHKLEEGGLPIDAEEMTDAFLGFWASQTVALEALAALLGAKREQVLEPWTLGLIDLGKKRGVEACVARAKKAFTDASARMETLFKSYDAVLSPVFRIPPFKIGYHDPKQDFDTLLFRVLDEVAYTPLHNACGTPAMSVPLYWTAEGLPIGSQFAAWRGGEATLLGLAYELEAARPWRKRRPLVSAI